MRREIRREGKNDRAKFGDETLLQISRGFFLLSLDGLREIGTAILQYFSRVFRCEQSSTRESFFVTYIRDFEIIILSSLIRLLEGLESTFMLFIAELRWVVAVPQTNSTRKKKLLVTVSLRWKSVAVRHTVKRLPSPEFLWTDQLQRHVIVTCVLIG